MTTLSSVDTQGRKGILPVTLTWRTLLQVTAVVDLIVMAIMGVILGDRLPLGLAIIIAVGLWLLHWRGGLPGMVLLALVFGDTTMWTLSASITDIVLGEELLRIVVPLSLAAISGAGLVSAIATVITRHRPEAGTRAARLVALAAIALFALGLLAGLFIGNAQAQVLPAGALALKTENLRFSTTELTADHGQITVDVDNHDVWWHTFTIDGLGVNLQIPSSGNRKITFNAPPGVYTFYCSIPGHAQLGMKGTLVVK